MAKNYNPWFKFFYRDWIESERIMEMSLAAEGLYIRCLALQAIHGSIPSSKDKLAKLLHRTVKEIGPALDEILPHFETEVSENESRILNQKLQNIIQNSDLKKSNYSQARGRILPTCARTSVSASVSGSVSASGSEDEKEPKPEKEQDPPKKREKKLVENYVVGPNAESFLRFWSAYPNKNARHKAFEIWDNYAPGPETEAKILASIEKKKSSPMWRKDGGEYIELPTTFLNQRRWEDEGVSGITPMTARGGYTPHQTGFVASKPVVPASAEDRAEVERIQREMEI